MKKALSLIFALIFITSLAGCKSNDSPAGENSSVTRSEIVTENGVGVETATKWFDESAVKNPELLERRIVYYINQYRKEEKLKDVLWLPEMTVLARERSKQLVENFRHDKAAEEALADKYKYGKSKDDKYIFEEGGELVINKCSNIGDTVDSMAKFIADGLKSSKRDWEKVADKAVKYIAVGTYYDKKENLWYTSIYGSSTNKYE